MVTEIWNHVPRRPLYNILLCGSLEWSSPSYLSDITFKILAFNGSSLHIKNYSCTTGVGESLPLGDGTGGYRFDSSMGLYTRISV